MPDHGQGLRRRQMIVWEDRETLCLLLRVGYTYYSKQHQHVGYSLPS